MRVLVALNSCGYIDGVNASSEMQVDRIKAIEFIQDIDDGDWWANEGEELFEEHGITNIRAFTAWASTEKWDSFINNFKGRGNTNVIEV